VAIELWRAKVSLATIRKQLKMSERSLWTILSFAKSNPDAPVAGRKRDPGSGTSNLKMTPTLLDHEEAVDQVPHILCFVL
jgi:hypothetical protein